MNRAQREIKLNGEIQDALREQGFHATKTSDRFASGRPDTRMGRSDLGQMDFELKYITADSGVREGDEFDTTLKKIQWLNLNWMNEAGMPAVCLVYLEQHRLFLITTFLRVSLTPGTPRVKQLPQPRLIDGAELFSKSMELLRGRGYKIRD